MDPLDREIEAIEQAHLDGLITSDEMQKQIRDVVRSYRAEAEESAERAYRDEMDRW